jgi:hypothetical protein
MSIRGDKRSMLGEHLAEDRSHEGVCLSDEDAFRAKKLFRHGSLQQWSAARTGTRTRPADKVNVVASLTAMI